MRETTPPQPRKIEQRHAELAANLVGAMAAFRMQPKEARDRQKGPNSV